ncbi:hypothetical protein DGG96_09435 [Legionella qingyii]|uniref:Uncharacterized protein n=1 Tax=Legionella qingyii TaxID=2184757 RepID=A0A317U544_9GAMM|nr:hypothetical protein DGG96_09435 [Legionella qingyii]
MRIKGVINGLKQVTSLVVTLVQRGTPRQDGYANYRIKRTVLAGEGQMQPDMRHCVISTTLRNKFQTQSTDSTHFVTDRKGDRYC